MKITIMILVILIGACSQSAKKASYYQVQKKLEKGSLEVYKELRVDEYINAFDQPGLSVPTKDEPMSLSVEYFNNSQPKGNNTMIAQVAIRSRNATKEEANIKMGICIVLDISGSMNWDNKISDARKALSQAVMELRDKNEFALVVFNERASVKIKPTVINHITRREIQLKIDDIVADGGTNIEDGLVEGYKTMSEFSKDAVSRLILITDGNSNVGVTDPRELAKKAGTKYLEGAKISTVGIGDDVDEELLRRIATVGNGQYFYTDKATTLRTYLSKDLQNMIIPVAKKVGLEIKAKKGFVIKKVYGFEEFVKLPGVVSIPFTEINVDDWRIMMVEFEGENITMSTSPITATLEYELIETGKKKTITKSKNIKWHYNDKPKTNPTVARNAVLFSNAMSLMKISELYKQENYEEALKLAKVQVANIEVAQKWDDSKMFKDEVQNFNKVVGILKNEQRKVIEPSKINIAPDTKEDSGSLSESLVKEGLNITKDLIPGPWSLVIRLIDLAI